MAWNVQKTTWFGEIRKKIFFDITDFANDVTSYFASIFWWSKHFPRGMIPEAFL